MPRLTPWEPNKGDVEPQAKLHAVRVVEAIGSWSIGDSGPTAAERRVSSMGADPSLIRQAGPLLGSGDSAVVAVIDAQYGGILAEAASVLVVCRQWRATGESTVAGGTTVDVRLRLVNRRWRVIALHPAKPGQPARRLSTLAASVLSSPRIDLPPASTADVKAGGVHDSVLAAMLRLAQVHRVGVSVVRSGHPIHVFGTRRLSDHPPGRAFDTWSIDGQRVVDPHTPKRLITGYMRLAADAGSYNVGGPYLLAGTGNQFFSDATHHDHVHAGFRS